MAYSVYAVGLTFGGLQFTKKNMATFSFANNLICSDDGVLGTYWEVWYGQGYGGEGILWCGWG